MSAPQQKRTSSKSILVTLWHDRGFADGLGHVFFEGRGPLYSKVACLPLYASTCPQNPPYCIPRTPLSCCSSFPWTDTYHWSCQGWCNLQGRLWWTRSSRQNRIHHRLRDSANELYQFRTKLQKDKKCNPILQLIFGNEADRGMRPLIPLTILMHAFSYLW